MKLKSKKSALLLSFTSLLLCFAMLAGSTFAWFTDTATTGVNKIVAGNLKVDIIGANSEDHVETLNFTKATGAEGEQLLWEPGCRYLTEGFRIANKGNLALKWKAQVNKGTTAANEGDYDLLDVIDFYLVTSEDVNDMGTVLADFSGALKKTETSDVYYIKGVMKKEADNNYQNLTLEGITITVVATQDTVENDSINNQYDKDAEFPTVIGSGTKDDPYLIHDAATLSTIKNNGTYTYYKVTDGVTEIDCTNVSALNLYGEFDGNGATLKNLKKSLFHNVGNGKNGDDTTVLKNFTAVMNTPNSLVFNISGKNTEFNNVKVSGYMEGTWNMAAFVNYGTANSDGTAKGYDYTVNFVKCACDATIVSKSNSSAAILVGYTYPGNGNKATIRLDKATDDGINGAKLIAKPDSNGHVTGFKYYGLFVGGGEVYVDGNLTTQNTYAITKLTAANPTKNADGTYSVAKAENAATVKTNMNASLTVYNNGTPDINKGGITFSLGAATGASFDDLLGGKTIRSVKIVNNTQPDDTCKYTIENDGTLTVYTNRTDNYAVGKVFITVSQYDANGVLVSVGELTIAKKTDVNGDWTIN